MKNYFLDMKKKNKHYFNTIGLAPIRRFLPDHEEITGKP